MAVDLSRITADISDIQSKLAQIDANFDALVAQLQATGNTDPIVQAQVNAIATQLDQVRSAVDADPRALASASASTGLAVGVAPSVNTLNVGDTVQLNTTVAVNGIVVTDGSAGTPSFASADQTVVSVTGSGLVQGVGPGTTSVNVSFPGPVGQTIATSGASGSAKFTVNGVVVPVQPAGPVAASPVAGTSNVGNATVSAVTPTSAAVSETITATADPLDTPQTWAVSGSVSGPLGEATEGVPFTSSVIAFTINIGSTPTAGGDTFTIAVTAGTPSVASARIAQPFTSGNPQVPATQNVLTQQNIPQQGLAGSFGPPVPVVPSSSVKPILNR
jgi:hypothetical protein